MNKLVVKKRILEDHPNFVFENITKIGEGMDSVAFLVNDSLVFRFPKTNEIRRNLAKEIAALPILQKQLNVAIPDFEHIGAKNAYVGYKKIEGEFLTKEFFFHFQKKNKTTFKKRWRNF